MEKILVKNPTAYHNYSIEDTIEAGIVLTGTEIKSIRNGKCNIKDTYVMSGGKLCTVAEATHRTTIIATKIQVVFSPVSVVFLTKSI